MKPKATLRHFLALAGSSLLGIASASAATYYWDGNNDTTGFGTAGGTWAAPTAGTLTSGWSTSGAGTAIVNGNSVTTTTGDTLTFNGLASGTINVSGTVNSGNFGVNIVGTSVVLSGGTINFANTVTLTMNGSGTLFEIGSLITGAATSLTTDRTGTLLRLSNTGNSYSGSNSFAGTIEVTSLVNGGLNSSIGASSSAANRLVLGNGGRAGTLKYIGGTNASTDRLFTLGNGGSALDSSGTGTLNFTNTGAVAFDTANVGRSLTLSGSNTDLNILNPLLQDNGTGVVSLAKSGAGTWVLANNANSYTGQTSVQVGTLVIGSIADYNSESAIGKGTAGTAIILGNANNTGTLLYNGGTAESNRTFQINSSSNTNTGGATILNNGTGALTFTASTFNATYTNGNALSRTLTIGGTNGGTIQGVIQNSSATLRTDLVKSGGGTWTLNGASSYTGTTAIQQGNLIAGVSAPSAANGAFGNATSEINLGVAGTNDNAGILIGGAFNVGRNIRLLTSNTTDSGTRVLTLGGNTAANSEFSGNIFLGTTNQAGRGVTLTAANGGQVTFSGVIQNPTGMDATTYTVTKAGLGTVVMGNANTYSGVTNVSQGTLLVNNTTGSGTGTGNVIVANGGTLGGSGIISGNVTTQDGGTFAAGTSIESLATGSLTQEAGSTFAYEANNNMAANVAGDLTAVTGNLTFDLTNAAILTLNDLGSGSWADNEKLTLISYTGTWNGGLFTYLGNTVNDDSSIVFSGYNWIFDYNDTAAGTNFTTDLTGSNFVTMTAVSAVPEPGATLLGGLGILLILRRRR